MRPTNSAQLEALRTRRAQLDAEILRLQARARVQTRKEDTRRKILAGAVLLGEMAKDQKLDAWARQLLSKRLLKPRDRALFGLDIKAVE